MKKTQGKIIVRSNTSILTMVKLKSTNDVVLTTRDSNNLRGDSTRLGSVCFCDDSHDKILDIIFQRNK